MRDLLRGLLLLVSLWPAESMAQPLPTGAREDYCQIGRLDLDKVRVRVTPCGGLFGLEAKGSDGSWYLLTSPADGNRRSAVVDHAGIPQVAACGGGAAIEDWRFWHSSGSYALVDESRADGAWFPRWNRVTSRDPVECWKTVPWKVEADGFDTLTHSSDPAAVHWDITLTATEAATYSKVAVATVCTRLPVLPGYGIKHFSNPSLCLGYDAVSHVSLDGGVTQIPVANLANSAADPASIVSLPEGKQVWVRCRPANRWLVLRFTEGTALRLYKHPVQAPKIVVVNVLVTNSLITAGQSQSLNYSLEVR
jgi:hypothetical protein